MSEKCKKRGRSVHGVIKRLFECNGNGHKKELFRPKSWNNSQHDANLLNTATTPTKPTLIFLVESELVETSCKRLRQWGDALERCLCFFYKCKVAFMIFIRSTSFFPVQVSRELSRIITKELKSWKMATLYFARVVYFETKKFVCDFKTTK